MKWIIDVNMKIEKGLLQWISLMCNKNALSKSLMIFHYMISLYYLPSYMQWIKLFWIILQTHEPLSTAGHLYTVHNTLTI